MHALLRVKAADGEVKMCITGGLGIPGSAKERTSYRNCFGGVFMGFSITTAVLGGIIIITYAQVIALFDLYLADDYYHGSRMAVFAFMLILGIAAFSMGIAAPVCLCLMKVCACCSGPAENQAQGMMYSATTAGYVMTQGPVAVPVQVGAAMAPVQAQYAQGPQPQMVLVGVSGEAGGQPVMAQAAAPGPMPGTVSFPQGVEKPPLYA